MLKLNTKGISHLFIPLLLVIVGVAVVGTYMLVSSSAETTSKAKGLLPVHMSMSKQAKAQFIKESKNRNKDGRHSYTFIKIGDSITSGHYSLYGLGCYKPKSLDEKHGYFKTIMRYRNDKVNFGNREYAEETCADRSESAKRDANSWNRASYAAAKGATSAYALSSAREAGIDRENCRGKQLLLECELSIVRPRYAIIQLGTNDARVIGHNLGSKEVRPAGSKLTQAELAIFKKNLSRQIGIIRTYKTTPILMTVPAAKVSKAFTAGGNARISQVNGEIRQLAREADVPIIDFHAAQARQKNGKFATDAGLGPDGIHPSTYGLSRAEFKEEARSGKTSAKVFQSSADFNSPAVQNNGMNVRNLLIVDALTRLDGFDRKN